MSKIELNSISVNKSIEKEPLFYVGAVVPSKSGYLFPKLFTTTIDFLSTFDSFKYDQMYLNLLNNGIPLCLLPVLTPESKYNRCSLRLNHYSEDHEGIQFQYTYPKLGKDYTTSDLDISKVTELSASRMTLGDMSYVLILDFSKVSYPELYKNYGDMDESVYDSNYVVLDCGGTDEDRIRQLTCSSRRVPIVASNFDIWGESYEELLESYMEYCRTSDDPLYDAPDIPNEDLDQNLDSMKSILENFKSRWNSNDYQKHTESTCKDSKDIVIDIITNVINKVDLPNIDLINLVLIDLDDWIETILNNLWIEDFWIIDNRTVVDKVESILKMIPDDEYLTDPDITEINKKNHIINHISSNLKLDDLTVDKLAIFTESPAIIMNLYNLPGFKLDGSFNYTQDKLCEFTDKNKVVEFYSKIKGPIGKNISITISDVKDKPDLYNIEITDGISYEDYVCYLFDLTGDYSSNEDYINICEISNQSKLVDVYLYNYRLDGKLIDARFLDITSNQFDPSNNRNISELVLPLGTFKLDRVTDENPVYIDQVNTLESYKTSEWYPDLFLVPEVPDDVEEIRDSYGILRGKVTYLDHILDLVDCKSDNNGSLSPDESICSQALINLDYKKLNREWYTLSNVTKDYTQLKSKDNRLLYFYGNSIMNGVEIPVIYNYIFNILNQYYLRYPASNFYYDPFAEVTGGTVILKEDTEASIPFSNRIESISVSDSKSVLYLNDGSNINKFTIVDLDGYSIAVDTSLKTYKILNLMEFLDDRKINTLKYDNLKYYWESIKEPLQQSSVFMIRFISSKYVREIFKINHELPGMKEIYIRKLLNEVNRTCMDNLQFVTDSNINFTRDGNKLSVTIEIHIPKLINKTYKINIQLNV